MHEALDLMSAPQRNRCGGWWHTWNPFKRWRPKFKEILGYAENPRLAWAKYNSVSKFLFQNRVSFQSSQNVCPAYGNTHETLTGADKGAGLRTLA